MFDLARITGSGLVARIDFHESIGSTSDRALALAAHAVTDLPLLVLAKQQTAGRGRGTNRWWTSDGALTFSLVLEALPTRLSPERWPQVALVAGIAVCDALQTLAPAAPLRVKWPNDVYLTGRKIGGILSESVPGCRDRLVVGIGINVNNRVEETANNQEPKNQEPINRGVPVGSSVLRFLEFGSTAISLIDHDGVSRDLTDVLVAVLDQFDRRWQELLNDRFGLVAAAYRERCFLTGRAVTIEQPGKSTVVGICRGIDDSGALRLRTAAGEQTVVSGTVVGWDGR